MLPPIVDCHVHWRDPRTNPYETLSDGVTDTGARGGSAAQVYLPQDYLADAAPHDIIGVVHIEAEWQKSNPVAETEWLHGLDTAGVPLLLASFGCLRSDVWSVL